MGISIPVTCSARGSFKSLPPKTCSGAATEARSALRRFRDAAKENNTLPTRLTVQLPLPSPAFKDDIVRAYDEGEWPGGVQQKFRALRPLIEDHFLEGFNQNFIGMLESPADGLGVWDTGSSGVTVVTNVSNATFAPFARLCKGDFGSRVLDDGHLLIAVNSSWTSSKDIGQLWDWKLRETAAELIDDSSKWEPLWHFEDVRTGDGATGLLLRSFPDPWRLYLTPDAPWKLFGSNEEPLEPGDVIFESVQRPTKSEMRQALNEASAARKNNSNK